MDGDCNFSQQGFDELEDFGIEIIHVRWTDGICRLSLNGQGHLPCEEHNFKRKYDRD